MKNKQLLALEKSKLFFDKNNLNNENLTLQIWDIINDENIQTNINDVEANELSENWSDELVGELQRQLVNYQLHLMKIGKTPEVFLSIKDLMDKIPEDGLNLLDIGCTTGYYYEVFNNFNPEKFNYKGCDYNIESIKIAKRYYSNIDFSIEDLTKLSFEDKSYDISFLSGVIEHVPDYKTGLNELCRITDKYIILHRINLTQNKTFCKQGTQYFVPVIRYTYNIKEFFDILKSNGFEVIWENHTVNNGKSYILKRIEL